MFGYKIGFVGILLMSLCSFAMYRNYLTPPVDKALYNKFLGSFHTVQFPYKIDFSKKFASRFDQKNELSTEFTPFIPSMRRGMMSRMGPDDFFADAIIAQNDKFSAVVYITTRPYTSNKDDNYKYGTYMLVTMDNDGNLISQQSIARSHGEMNVQTATINKDYTINIASYDKISDKEPSESYTLAINTDGVLVKNGNPIGKVAPELNKTNQQKLQEEKIWEF